MVAIPQPTACDIGSGLGNPAWDQDFLLGTVATDGERHRDGTREFITLLDGLVASQEGELRLDAPAIGMTSAELVRASGADRSLLCWSFSCHVAPTPCMRCPGCTKQRAVLNGLSLPNVASNPP